MKKYYLFILFIIICFTIPNLLNSSSNYQIPGHKWLSPNGLPTVKGKPGGKSHWNESRTSVIVPNGCQDADQDCYIIHPCTGGDGEILEIFDDIVAPGQGSDLIFDHEYDPNCQ